MPTLKYKTALVTGASRGIGRATALARRPQGREGSIPSARTTSSS